MYCKKCGTGHQSDVGFCKNCGYNFATGASANRKFKIMLVLPLVLVLLFVVVYIGNDSGNKTSTPTNSGNSVNNQTVVTQDQNVNDNKINANNGVNSEPDKDSLNSYQQGINQQLLDSYQQSINDYNQNKMAEIEAEKEKWDQIRRDSFADNFRY